MKVSCFSSRAASWSFLLILFWTTVFLLMGGALTAQEEAKPEKDVRPVRNTFESIWLIDNQTVMVPVKGTFEMDIQHRFGVVNDGYDNFWGLFAASNFRIGFDYVPVERLQLGFGFTKVRKYWDFNAKYAILRQGRSGGSPFSVSYFVNAGVDTREKDNFIEGIDRLSYFHQLMVGRKISTAFSIQAAVSLSHFNFVEAQMNSDALPERMDADHMGLSLSGKYSISSIFGIIANFDIPLTDHETGNTVIKNPEANMSFGIEMVSSSHAFQIFVGRYQSIIPQLNNARNLNEDFLIGFNITRLWNF